MIGRFTVGNWVQKLKGDYTFQGIVVGVVYKYDFVTGYTSIDQERYVVQNRQGILMIMSDHQLEPWNGPQEAHETTG